MPLIDDKTINEKLGNVNQVAQNKELSNTNNTIKDLKDIVSNVKEIVTMYKEARQTPLNPATQQIKQELGTMKTEHQNKVIWLNEAKLKTLLGNDFIASQLPEELKTGSIYDLIVNCKTDIEKEKLIKVIKDFINGFVELK